MQFVALDSNIYRQLGVNFDENIDYNNLCNLLEMSPNEFSIIDIVREELMDYFQNDIVEKATTDIERAFLAFEKNKYLKTLKKPRLGQIKKNAIELFSKKLWGYWINTGHVDSKLILKFCLANKRECKKDNTRDLLILLSLISHAKNYPEDRIIFITNDHIFYDNHFFKDLISKNKINNIEIIESIAGYLSKYGVQFNFINEEIILKSINSKIIKEGLMSEINCLPSYINPSYNNVKIVPSLVKCTISKPTIEEYYTYFEDETSTIKLVSYIYVHVKAIFDSESNQEILNLHNNEKSYPSYFDEFNRPVYNNNVLFILEGNVNIEKEKITKQKFIDFDPDYNFHMRRAAHNTVQN
jgi:hypothetical protein